MVQKKKKIRQSKTVEDNEYITIKAAVFTVLQNYMVDSSVLVFLQDLHHFFFTQLYCQICYLNLFNSYFFFPPPRSLLLLPKPSPSSSPSFCPLAGNTLQKFCLPNLNNRVKLTNGKSNSAEKKRKKQQKIMKFIHLYLTVSFLSFIAQKCIQKQKNKERKSFC